MLLKRLQGLLVKFDKLFIFFCKTYLTMVFWLIKYVFTNSVTSDFDTEKAVADSCQAN
jgi:hypothetical protein